MDEQVYVVFKFDVNASVGLRDIWCCLYDDYKLSILSVRAMEVHNIRSLNIFYFKM